MTLRSWRTGAGAGRSSVRDPLRVHKRRPATSLVKRAGMLLDAFLPASKSCRAAVVLVIGAALLVGGLVSGFILQYHVRWWIVNKIADPSPIALDGSLSSFTLLVLTFSERLSLLHKFIRHYSQCTSVLEVLVIWNKGPVPHASEFSSRVPVRIRVQERNSLNNRFAPDAHIRTRAVLSLDDDIFMPCEDLEHGFAEWRRHADSLVGFHLRLAEGSPLRYMPERTAVARNEYNLILTGSAFMDAHQYFPLYQRAAAGTALVDELFNCEDILMNFIIANATRSGAAVKFVRPRLRIDVSFTSGVPRLSGKTDSHQNKRDICVDSFSAMFGHSVLQPHTPEWGPRGPPNCALSRLVGCLFT